MRPRSLLVLALLVLGLGAFVWFWERKQPGTAEREADAKKVLTAVEQKDVREVVVAHGGTEVRLVREAAPGQEGEGEAEAGGDDEDDEAGHDDSLAVFESTAEWRLAAPLQARADRMAVDGLVTSLLGLEKGRTLEQVDRGEYGLAPPAATVTLVTGEGKHTLEVGREIPGTDQRVVALAGSDEVWTVPGAFWGDLTRPAGDWRSRQLFPGQRHEIERLSLRRGGETIVLAQSGEDFRLEAPLADRADRERVDDLLGAITSLEAVEFLAPADAGGAGLDAPLLVVEVRRRGHQEPFRIVLGDERGQGDVVEGVEPVRAARVDGQLVTVRSPTLVDAAARGAHEWRSRAWTSLPVYDVDRVEVADGGITDVGGAMTLARADADWKRDGVRIFYATVSDLLAAVTDARAERLLPAAEGAALTSGSPALTLRLVGRESREETLQLWPAGEGGAPARVSGRDVVLLLPASLPPTLAQHLQAVRGAEALPEPTPAPGEEDGAEGDEGRAPAGAATPP